MDTWGIPEEPSGASQPAFQIYPLADARCVGIKVVSFNMGMPQSMLESDRCWHRAMEGICVQPLGAQVGEAPRTVGLCVQVAVVGGHAALQQPVLGGSRWPLAFTPLQGRLA